MEFLNGGDLFDQLSKVGGFSEDISRLLFIQLMNGVDYIHQKGIAHLDLKLENVFVCATDDSEILVKIGDFGLSQRTTWPFKDIIDYEVGTTGYQAPE